MRLIRPTLLSFTLVLAACDSESSPEASLAELQAAQAKSGGDEAGKGNADGGMGGGMQKDAGAHAHDAGVRMERDAGARQTDAGGAVQITGDAGPLVCPRGGNTGPIRVVFNCDQITVDTCKDLSNVVLEFGDGSRQRFEGLKGRQNSFAAPSGGTIVGVWVKAGENHSGDGPGYGERFNAPANNCPDGGVQNPPTQNPPQNPPTTPPTQNPPTTPPTLDPPSTPPTDVPPPPPNEPPTAPPASDEPGLVE